VYAEDAYAQGKMLDHSQWLVGSRILPRNITPSDVDFFIDDKGHVLFCELSSKYHSWEAIDRGQRLGYINIIKGTKNLSILCKHCTPKGKQVDTRNGIDAFQVLLPSDDGRELRTQTFFGNDRWQDFVFAWFDDAWRVYESCLKNAVFDAPRGVKHDLRADYVMGEI